MVEDKGLVKVHTLSLVKDGGGVREKSTLKVKCQQLLLFLDLTSQNKTLSQLFTRIDVEMLVQYKERN